jgi:hypothetical protein
MSGFKQDPESVAVNGVDLRCEICKNGTFYHRKAQLQGAVASFFDLEWIGPTAHCLICSNCGYIHWFMPL